MNFDAMVLAGTSAKPNLKKLWDKYKANYAERIVEALKDHYGSQMPKALNVDVKFINYKNRWFVQVSHTNPIMISQKEAMEKENYTMDPTGIHFGYQEWKRGDTLENVSLDEEDDDQVDQASYKKNIEQLNFVLDTKKKTFSKWSKKNKADEFIYTSLLPDTTRINDIIRTQKHRLAGDALADLNRIRNEQADCKPSQGPGPSLKKWEHTADARFYFKHIGDKAYLLEYFSPYSNCLGTPLNSYIVYEVGQSNSLTCVPQDALLSKDKDEAYDRKTPYERLMLNMTKRLGSYLNSRQKTALELALEAAPETGGTDMQLNIKKKKFEGDFIRAWED
jgi:hypothetical protein